MRSSRIEDPILWRRWLAELRAMMAAMSWERGAVDGAVEPAEYLRHAVESIGVGVAAVTMPGGGHDLTDDWRAAHFASSTSPASRARLRSSSFRS